MRRSSTAPARLPRAARRRIRSLLYLSSRIARTERARLILVAPQAIGTPITKHIVCKEPSR